MLRIARNVVQVALMSWNYYYTKDIWIAEAKVNAKQEENNLQKIYIIYLTDKHDNCNINKNYNIHIN